MDKRNTSLDICSFFRRHALKSNRPRRRHGQLDPRIVPVPWTRIMEPDDRPPESIGSDEILFLVVQPWIVVGQFGEGGMILVRVGRMIIGLS